MTSIRHCEQENHEDANGSFHFDALEAQERIGCWYLRLQLLPVGAAVLNGLLAAPLMGVIMHMAASPKVMDNFTIPRYLRVVGWAATPVMFGVSIVVFMTWK